MKVIKEQPSKEMLLELVMAGKSAPVIAEEFGVSYQTVKKWFDRNGIRYSYMVEAPPVYELVDLLKRFNCKQIAEMYDLDKTHKVQAWLRMYGLRQYTKKPRKQKLPDDVRDKVMNDYFLGLIDEADISEMYDLPIMVVEAEIREYGLSEDMLCLMPDREELKKEASMKTLNELAEWYGTSETQILRWFRSLNVKQGDL